MIAFVGFIGTMSSVCESSNTIWWYMDAAASSGDSIRHISDKTPRKIENAIKARETLLFIAKTFKPLFKVVLLARRKLTYRRILFCKSGFLPRRIRAIKKSK